MDIEPIKITEYSRKTKAFWENLKTIITKCAYSEVNGSVKVKYLNKLKELYQKYLNITIENLPQFDPGDFFFNILKIMKLNKKIDNLYIERVNEESRSLYPLTKPEKPGKHFIIALIGYYIFGINLLPLDFNSNLNIILTAYGDVNNNFPLFGNGWHNPRLIPYMNYVNFCYETPVTTIDITKFLHFDDAVFNNIVLNIIKVRYKFNFIYQKESDKRTEKQLMQRINKAMFDIKGIKKDDTKFEDVVKAPDIQQAQLTLKDFQFKRLFTGDSMNEEEEKALIADNLYTVEQIISKYQTKKKEKKRTGK